MSKKSTIGLLLVVAVFAIAQTAMAVPPRNAPDAGSSSLLLGAALASLVGLRSFFRK